MRDKLSHFFLFRRRVKSHFEYTLASPVGGEIPNIRQNVRGLRIRLRLTQPVVSPFFTARTYRSSSWALYVAGAFTFEPS